MTLVMVVSVGGLWLWRCFRVGFVGVVDEGTAGDPNLVCPTSTLQVVGPDDRVQTKQLFALYGLALEHVG